MVPIKTATVNRKCVAVAAKGMNGNWKEMRFKCTPAQFAKGLKAYNEGAFMQDAFPFLTSNEREFLISGITPTEWKAIFGSEPHE